MKITIPQPCHENWENMTPDEKGRFCGVCSKSVRDFTKSSDLEIMNDLSGNSKICGNFKVEQLDRNLHHSFINSLFTKFAVGFILTSGGIISAQTQPKEHCAVKKDTLKIKGEIVEAPSKLEVMNSQKIRIGGAAKSIDLNSQPLYILDGEIINDKKFRQIDQKNIKKVEVLKGMSATALYGAKAKYGVIIITLKDQSKNSKRKIR